MGIKQKVKILKQVRKQILEESEITTNDTGYFEGWDHATGNALRIIDLTIKRLKDAKYKTFSDLEFAEAPFGSVVRAGLEFDNGYGVSVVEEGMMLKDYAFIYEVAVLKDGSLCYDSGITEDVFRFQTSDEVSEIMLKIQKL